MSEMTPLFPRFTREEALMLSPLQLAYVGDSVHALLARTQLIQKNLPVRDMHAAANHAVSAVSQYQAVQALWPLLSQEEQSVVKRGRNAHPHHGAPKSASVEEYAGATGLETLLGYLFLTGQWDRIKEIMPYIQGEK